MVMVDEELTKKASCIWAYVEAAGWSKGKIIWVIIPFFHEI